MITIQSIRLELPQGLPITVFYTKVGATKIQFI